MIKEWSKSWENYIALIATCLALVFYGISTDSQKGRKTMWQSLSVLMAAVSLALLMYRYSMIIKAEKTKPNKTARYLLIISAILAAVGVGVAISKNEHLVMYSLFASVLMFWVNLFNPVPAN